VTRKGAESPFSFQDLIDAAKDLIEDVDSDPVIPIASADDVGTYYAHWVYPKARAMR
jgi:hypothetical protein